MTTPTPPLVDIIETVIYNAQGLNNLSNGSAIATDEVIARAVLDALAEAEDVNWSSEHVSEGKRAIELHQWADQSTALKKMGQHGGRVVFRITGS